MYLFVQGYYIENIYFFSFLELACHCVVLDLFDEELFQSIAYDPEAWLYNLLQVNHKVFFGKFKIETFFFPPII